MFEQISIQSNTKRLEHAVTVLLAVIASLIIGVIIADEYGTLIFFSICGVLIWLLLVRNPMVAIAISLSGLQFYPLIANGVGVGTSSTLTAVIYIILASSYLFSLCFTNVGKLKHVLLRKETILFLVFYLWMILNWATLARYNSIAIQRVLAFAPLLMVAPFIAGMLVNRAQIVQLSKLVAIIGIISLTITYLNIESGQISLSALAPQARLSINESVNPLRVAYANGLAAIFLLILANNAASRNSMNRKIWQIFAIFILFGALFFIIASASRGPILAIAGSLALMVSRQKLKQQVTWLIILCVVVAMLIFALRFLPESILNRYVRLTLTFNSELTTTFMDSITSNRWSIWVESVQMWRSSMLLGVGVGNVQVSDINRFVHNFLIEILVELGLVGLAIFLVFFAAIIYFTVKQINNARKSKDNIVAIISTTLLVYSLATMSFSGMLQLQPGFWLACGLILNFQTQSRLTRQLQGSNHEN